MSTITNEITSTIYSKNSTTNKSLTAEEWNKVAKATYDLINEHNSESSSGNNSESSNLSATSITITNEDTEELFKLKINEDGEWYVATDAKTDMKTVTEDSSKTLNATTANTLPTDTGTFQRGYGAYYSLGSEADTTTAKLLAQAAQSTDSTDVIKGDRIRFGSWYYALPGQKEFNCSHDFIEIVNCGTVDFPLSSSKLVIITCNDINATNPLLNTNFSTYEFNLSGGVKAGSSYLIRGKSHDGSDKILISDADIEIGFNFQNKNIAAFILCHKDMTVMESGSLVTITASCTTDVTKYWQSSKRGLIDVVFFTETTGINYFNIVNGSGNAIYKLGTATYKDCTYSKQQDCIIKDLYELDCAKQGFRGLNDELVSSQTRMGSTTAAQETIPLTSNYITFPHGLPKYAISNFTPKSSAWEKNILTDKTKPSFVKPNMVTCSFGMDGNTTRCFNWISMGETSDEYVWIRVQGSNSAWSRFESYKSGDGTDTAETDSTTTMHRKNFAKSIINSVYARMSGTFPGDSTYTYTAHKCIVYIQSAIASGESPVTYEYVVGKSNTSDTNPNKAKCSDIQTFTIYPTNWKPKVYHTSDQQGFTWLEYQVWSAAAEEINTKINKECNASTKLFPVFINTGDMTQNGTRINEWLDYYNGGQSLFDHIEQMNVVGNNDLCNSIKVGELGTGDDDGKSCPYYFHVFYCYEIPNDITAIELATDANMTGPLICNDVYIPSMYYFEFPNTDVTNGDFHFIMVNSELTFEGCGKYFKTSTASGFTTPVNLYTGYKYGSKTAINDCQSGSLGKTLDSWLADLPRFRTIVACHEMPFTVTTTANLKLSADGIDRSIDASSFSLVGSHLNVFYSKSSAYDGNSSSTSKNENVNYDYTYWFSKLLSAHFIALCIGGHKHTYSVTYPINENSGTHMDVTDGINWTKLATPIKPADMINITDTTIDSTSLFLKDTSSNTLGVTYFMIQATGYKQTSNKELPSASSNYAMIVPKTSWTDSTSTAKAHNSLKYPMYATYEPNASYINCCLYRVVNILSEVADNKTGAATIALTLLNYATDTMYSEQLLIAPNTNKDSYINYWLVPTGYTNPLASSANGLPDRLFAKDGNYYYYTYADKTLTLVSDLVSDTYTLQLSI